MSGRRAASADLQVDAGAELDQEVASIGRAIVALVKAVPRAGGELEVRLRKAGGAHAHPALVGRVVHRVASERHGNARRTGRIRSSQIAFAGLARTGDESGDRVGEIEWRPRLRRRAPAGGER